MPRSAPAARSLLRPTFALSLALALVLLLRAPGPGAVLARQATPGATPTSVEGLAPATAWLLAQQDPGGGFPGYSGDLDPGTTADAVIALAAAKTFVPDANTALAKAVDYLDQHGQEYAAIGAGQAAKLAMAAVAGGRDPRAFAGGDLIATMQAPVEATPSPIAGLYGPDLYSHALVLLAFAAVREPVAGAAIAPLRATQQADGGWTFDGSADASAADSNTTAMIVQALVATGHGDDPMTDRALAFLASLLAPEGGFASGPADPLVADANSTALVLQALIAAGEDPAAATWANAPRALLRFQTPSGGVRYLLSDDEPNLLATLQAIPALAGQPLPVAVGCADGEAAGTNGCLPLAA